MFILEKPENLAIRLLQDWTAKGLIIFEQQARFVEVKVPFLVLDVSEVARAIATNFGFKIDAHLDMRAFAPGVNVTELDAYFKQMNYDSNVKENDLMLAAAILAHRGCPFNPIRSQGALGDYIHKSIFRRGRSILDPCPVEFLFAADDATPTIYANNPLAEVTRFTGPDYLSIKVGDDELRLRVEEALHHLEQGGSSAPQPQSEVDEWFGNPRAQKDDYYEE